MLLTSLLLAEQFSCYSSYCLKNCSVTKSHLSGKRAAALSFPNSCQFRGACNVSTFRAGVCWRVSLHTHTHTAKFSADLLVRLSSCRIFPQSFWAIMNQDWPHQVLYKWRFLRGFSCVQGLPRQHHQIRYVIHLPTLLCLQCQQLMQIASWRYYLAGLSNLPTMQAMLLVSTQRQAGGLPPSFLWLGTRL